MFLRTTKFFAQFVFLCSALLLVLSIIGAFSNYDARSSLKPGTNAPEMIYSEVQRSFDDHGQTPEFIQEALISFKEGMVFEWPHELGRIPVTDNWLLHGFSYLEGALNRIGVISVKDYFSVYQSLRYERAIERGFGVCSQNAVAFSDLLEREYGMKTQIVYLDGHVVSSVTLDGQQIIIDPSIGWYSGKTLTELENEPAFVASEYTELKWEELAQTYDARGNQVFEGVAGYNPKMKKLEHLFDYLKFILPIVMLVLSGGLIAYVNRKQVA